MRALKLIDLTQPPRPIAWLVDGLLPLNALSFFGADAGSFKTATAVYLAVQMARPEGKGEFLGRPVLHGPSLYLNFDNATGDALGVRYWLEPALQAFPDADRSLIHVLEPDSVAGATDEAIKEVYEYALVAGAKLIVWDSFEACFPWTNIIASDQVRAALYPLERMAVELGATCLVLDHLPKVAKGEDHDARGLKGNGAKRAASRAVHLFSLLPPEKTGGRYIYRWKQLKNSFAPPLAAFGVEVQRTREGLRLVETDLPDDAQDTKTERAIDEVMAYLEQHPGEVVERQALLTLAQGVGLGLTRAKQAVDAAVTRAGAVKVQLPGRGGPVGYRFESPDPNQATPPDAVTKIEKHDGDGLTFGSPPSDQNRSSDPNPPAPAPTPALDLERLPEQEVLALAWDRLETLPEAERPVWRTRLNRERLTAARELLARLEPQAVG